MNDLKTRYFMWMYKLVADRKVIRNLSYHKLLYLLSMIPFEYTVAMDANRYEDGIDLRYRFAYENNIDEREIAYALDDEPCSVLEMMIALSLRIENSIMENHEIGDRTAQWFWGMIDNLGLSSYTDDRYDEEHIRIKINRLLTRRYKRNGEGGLFTIRDPYRDMRKAEIWFQAMWYLYEL